MEVVSALDIGHQTGDRRGDCYDRVDIAHVQRPRIINFR